MALWPNSQGNHNGNYSDTGYPPVKLGELIRPTWFDIVKQATNRANSHLSYAATIMSRFQKRLSSDLHRHFQNINYKTSYGKFGNISVSQEIDHEVQEAVDETMQDMNMTSDNSTFREDLVRTLDTDIVMSSLDSVMKRAGNSDDDEDFFHNMPVKDETLFVVLVCMAIIVPIIIITLFGIFFYKKRRENRERREEMLLREQPEFSMDDYPRDARDDDDVPDLDLKNLRA